MKKIMAIIIALVVISSIGLVGCGNNPTGPTTDTKSVIIFKNGDFDGGTETDPTGHPNETARIGSFVLQGTGIVSKITKITLADNDVLFPMKDDFEKMILGSGMEQISSEINLETSTTGKYVFTLNPAKKLTDGKDFVVDIYTVNIKLYPLHFGYIPGVKIYSVTTIIEGTTSEKESILLLDLQPIYIGNSKG